MRPPNSRQIGRMQDVETATAQLSQGHAELREVARKVVRVTVDLDDAWKLALSAATPRSDPHHRRTSTMRHEGLNAAIRE